MLRLRVTRSGHPTQLVSVAKDVAVVGRAPDCDVVIDDPEMSRRHARFFQGTVVMDLGSRNGTWLDANRVSEPVLSTGQKLRLGQGDRAVVVEIEPPGAPGPETIAVATTHPSPSLDESVKAALPPAQRTALDDHLRELDRWMSANIAAHQRAAREFAANLLRSLSEQALTENHPIPPLKKLAGQREAELWRRATVRLADLENRKLDEELAKFVHRAAVTD